MESCPAFSRRVVCFCCHCLSGHGEAADDPGLGGHAGPGPYFGVTFNGRDVVIRLAEKRLERTMTDAEAGYISRLKSFQLRRNMSWKR